MRKLSETEVRRIKGELLRRVPPKNLAKQYKVSVESIWKIGRGEAWSWVQAERQVEVQEVTSSESLRRMERMLQESVERARVETVVDLVPPELRNRVMRLLGKKLPKEDVRQEDHATEGLIPQGWVDPDSLGAREDGSPVDPMEGV